MTPDELEARVRALEAARSDPEPPVPTIAATALYTVPEAAQRLRCQRANLYALVASGDLASIRVGVGRGGLRVLGADLLAFVDSRREGGPKPKMALKHMR